MINSFQPTNEIKSYFINNIHDVHYKLAGSNERIRSWFDL